MCFVPARTPVLPRASPRDLAQRGTGKSAFLTDPSHRCCRLPDRATRQVRHSQSPKGRDRALTSCAVSPLGRVNLFPRKVTRPGAQASAQKCPPHASYSKHVFSSENDSSYCARDPSHGGSARSREGSPRLGLTYVCARPVCPPGAGPERGRDPARGDRAGSEARRRQRDGRGLWGEPHGSGRQRLGPQGQRLLHWTVRVASTQRDGGRWLPWT